MGYPIDEQFEEVAVPEDRPIESGGWEIKRDDGWLFAVPADSPVEPKDGMTARFYGRGMGSPVRGLFLDGVQVFYRTVAEQEVHHNESLYGATIEEWLHRWDSGDGVWSVEMGGLGPGYEQAIQVTVAEVVRILIEGDYDADAWEDEDIWEQDRATIERKMFEVEAISNLDLSGAQFGAALSLASAFYRRGPISVMTNEKLESDRKIQVSKSFPQG